MWRSPFLYQSMTLDKPRRNACHKYALNVCAQRYRGRHAESGGGEDKRNQLSRQRMDVRSDVPAMMRQRRIERK